MRNGCFEKYLSTTQKHKFSIWDSSEMFCHTGNDILSIKETLPWIFNFVSDLKQDGLVLRISYEFVAWNLFRNRKDI